MASLVAGIQLVSLALTIMILAYVFLGYFLPPYHSVRRILGSIVEPMLAPIRGILPTVGMFDFSPVVLLILIQVLEVVLIQILRSG
ncbi:MAG TPA: YggT family protein [Anaerolineales bacterium]|nr:YggT family protein [Anaerolineales bacterium]